MKTINFNSNQFSYLSEVARQAMDEANFILKNHKSNSFGVDYKTMAEIENVRNFVAESLKLKAHEIFFSNGNSNSDIEIINNAVLFLKVQNIFTSIFENSQKLEYLKNLQHAGKINLIYIKTSEFGEINLDELKDKLDHTQSKSILSLSHANLYTGNLLPIKDILTICQSNHIYFHFDLSLTIGRYQIDFQKIKPDFISFDCILLNGPVGVGVHMLNDKIETNNQDYHHIKNNFRTSENKNLAQILGFYKSFSISMENLNDNRLKIIKLKQYFIEKTNSVLNIKAIDAENKKPGLINLIPLYIDKNIFGDYLIEKLDLKGISAPNLNYPIDLEAYSNHQFINIAINEEITEADIDYFIETIRKFQL